MNKNEQLVKLFLRLNGYFLVDNFIVHNGNADLSNSYDKIIPQLTETDLLGIRMPFQSETAGNLEIKNYERITLNSKLIDLVIVESKTGKENLPNPTWKNSARIENIQYLIRFFGITNNTKAIEKISNNLITHYKYKWGNYSIRYIIISENISRHYSEKGITYLTINEILDFIIKIRGECWIESELGIASHHSQWNPFMNNIFKIANMTHISSKDRKQLIRNFLNE